MNCIGFPHGLAAHTIHHAVALHAYHFHAAPMLAAKCLYACYVASRRHDGTASRMPHQNATTAMLYNTMIIIRRYILHTPVVVAATTPA